MPSLRLPRRRHGGGHRPANPKRRNAIVASVLGVVVFVAALVLWSNGGGSDERTDALPKPDATSSAPITTASPSPSASTSPSASPSGTTSAAAGLNLPDLPGTNSNVNPADLPPHTTVITVTSDSPILRYGYKTAYGSSSKEIKYLVKSPATVSTGTRGYGAQAVVGAQAGPYATYVNCSITVDGKTRTTQAVKGAYKIVVCVG